MTAPSKRDAMRNETAPALAGEQLFVVGKLGSMSRREAGKLIADAGGRLKQQFDDQVTLVVTGESALTVDVLDELGDRIDEATQQAAARGELRVITETELWERLGLIDAEEHVHWLYTPAMLADLLGVPIAVIRRWHRCSLIVPSREVRKLPYFDYQEVATARRLAELLAAGVRPREIERQLAAIGRLLPGAQRPLAQLSVIVEGKELLLRQGDGLLEPGGQLRFDFEADSATVDMDPSAGGATTHDSGDAGGAPPLGVPQTPEELLAAAHDLEDAGQLSEAVELYRAALVAGGGNAVNHFALAEALYRLNEVEAARERYYVAIELDGEFVEARFNLACVLAELGESELAVAAFEGALSLHSEYADAHYHLARLLDELGRREAAEEHWRRFRDQAPAGAWADEAERRLALSDSPAE